VYVPQAQDLVVELCAGQPFLIQTLCDTVFEHAARTEERTITQALVRHAARDMLVEFEHFRTLWGYAATDRRRLLLAICQRFEDGPDPITLAFLEMTLERHGVVVPPKERVGDDLEYLRELELLGYDRSTEQAAYRLEVPLMSQWIKQEIDFDDLVSRARGETEEY